MEPLSFGSRLALAFTLPWRVLFDGRLAAKVVRAESMSLEPEKKTPELPPEKAPEPKVDYGAALQLLSILQREGRFVDFLQEDLAGASDADIGAAARVVHEGCGRGLKDYVAFSPVRSEDEGAKITLESGYDAARDRVTGNVAGDPPFNGALAHHGWLVTKIELPTLSEDHDPTIVAPAEIEL